MFPRAPDLTIMSIGLNQSASRASTIRAVTSEVAEFTVKPDPYGQIVVDVQIEEGTYGYLALMDIAW